MTKQWVLSSVLSNWNSWREEFMHGRPFDTNPILVDPKRFRSFCYEYRVQRTIRAGMQEQFQLALRETLPKAVLDDSGREIDKLETLLRSKFGTHHGTRPIISVVSKVASFLRPDKFIAWDKYAKAGLSIVCGRAATTKWSSYQSYLQSVHGFRDSKLSSPEDLHRFFQDNAAKSTSDSAVYMRIIDTYLMWKGGRWQSRGSFK